MLWTAAVCGGFGDGSELDYALQIFSSLNKPRDGELYQSGEEMDMNTSEIHDQERLEIWQQLIVYTTMV